MVITDIVILILRSIREYKLAATLLIHIHYENIVLLNNAVLSNISSIGNLPRS